MRSLVNFLLVAILVAAVSPSPAQPVKDGDLIVSNYRISTTLPAGEVFAWSRSANSWTTVFSAGGSFLYDLWRPRMCALNTNLIVAADPLLSSMTAQMRQVDVATGSSTVLAGFAPDNPGPGEFALDHDGVWIGAGFGSSGATNRVWRVDLSLPNSLRVSTLYTITRAASGWGLWDIEIDRERTTRVPYTPYALSIFGSPTADVLHADRMGVLRTHVSLVGGGQATALLPLTGDYIVLLKRSPNVSLYRVDKKGQPTMVQGFSARNILDVRCDQRGCMWLVTSGPNSLLQLDENFNVVHAVSVPMSNGLSGVEIYGSRKLTCLQQGKTVSVSLKSHRLGDANQPYYLACSFSRRPPAPGKCLQFPSGDYLFLDHTDPLFQISVLGLAPQVFQGYRGMTDPFGAATATVNIPAFSPPLNITVFVAGVIVTPGGVTVTNTHWFVP